MDRIHKKYDLVVIGGGITGAGTFYLAAAMGLTPLLVEARDFAWAASSRSSKMVHGGLRYLKQGKFLLTRSAVMERQRLLSAYPGLVTPLEFIMPMYKHLGPSRTAMKAGLSIYSFMAGQRQHRFFDRDEARAAVSGLRSRGLISGVGFQDAQVDDARLVLRLIFDGCDRGGHALNYTRAQGVGRDDSGQICRVHLVDEETGREREVKTGAVINATGALAETLHPSPVNGFHIRPLRGSHLIFPGDLLDLDRVVSFFHPRDSRPIFIFPWEGALVLGTTDVDHGDDLAREPAISRQERTYLMEGLEFILPGKTIGPDEALSSIAGVRPVLSRGKKAASKESREHLVWKDKGLVTVAGGKLTTFGLLARDALKAAGFNPPKLRQLTIMEGESIPVSPGTEPGSGPWATASIRQRILGRHGRRAGAVAALADPETCQCMGTTPTPWAELIYGAGFERIRHLEDLMLRRTRIGLLLPGGGMDIMDLIQKRVSPFLDWDGARWEYEIKAYHKLWKRAHGPVEDQNAGY